MKKSVNKINPIDSEVTTKQEFANDVKIINRLGEDYTLDGYVEYAFVKSAYQNYLKQNENLDQGLVKNVTEKLILLNDLSDLAEKKQEILKDCKNVVKFIELQKTIGVARKSKKSKRPQTMKYLSTGKTVIECKKQDSIVDEETVNVLIEAFNTSCEGEAIIKAEKPHEAINRFLREKNIHPVDVCDATHYTNREGYETWLTHQDFHKYTHPNKTVRPSRERIIRMAFGLGLTIKETKYLVSLYPVKSFPEEGNAKDRLVCVALDNKYTFAEFCTAYEMIFNTPFLVVKKVQ